jgi:hypothetical protein
MSLTAANEEHAPTRATIRVSAAGFYALQRELAEANDRAHRAEVALAKQLEAHWRLIQDVAREQRQREQEKEQARLYMHERAAARVALGMPSEITAAPERGGFLTNFARRFGL